ncbi:MAG: Gfo/Idh/MocA family oxidoreductase [candidate division KSB1 bacterium]|nr:Gfo/Idh/MocA family oxidoreductase [candidate division KSB1 bacterium]MDZ7276315.1 Gfo/Idh/MocA family oxidoreductase [candidate division KSB1 bacterium]MDZ7287732.1 Gfo/Idh/MocA family oxidoreductase [candidate division KSB1 bacterium]MDZ7299928.1 Gfo/Idh/MocA family oxidoreductase [candidate division KSB1 bacterium]MDZ7305743.1 Gfo/Idh/MocA family oxidoreductase [candidate division KSB1 bacterium]
MKPVRFVVIGLGGYAAVHLEAVAWLAQQGLARLTGVVALASDRQRFPERVAALQAAGVRLFESIDAFFAAGAPAADVLTVPIGIHQHVPVSAAALAAGLHVYCEKPLAATVQEADQLIAWRNLAGRKIAVGFQHVYSNAVQQLKARICSGRLGRVQTITVLCSWPRSMQYYRRNDWAGRLRTGENWVLDSPANNAHSHYLLNALYLASPQEHAATVPAKLRAELYRAYPIASCDTLQMKFTTTEGVDCHVLFSHAAARELGPLMQITCERGRVTWEGDNGKTTILYAGGATEQFDNDVEPHWRYHGLRDLVQAIAQDIQPRCSLEIARCQTLTINAMHESCPEIVTVPPDFIEEVEDWEMFPPNTRGRFRRVRDLDRHLQAAAQQNLFLSEMGIAWATPRRVKTFVPGDYRHFPQQS